MSRSAIVRLPIAALLPAIILLGIQTLAGAPWNASTVFSGWLFSAAVLLSAFYARLDLKSGWLSLSPAAIGLFLSTFICALFYGWQPNTLAWALLGCIFAMLLGWIHPLQKELSLFAQALLEVFFAILAGLLPVALVQIETRFSSEEFFAALEASSLIIFWLALRLAFAWGYVPSPYAGRQVLRRRWALIGLGIATVVGGWFVVHQYQASFFSTKVPSYAGITHETPFLCGKVAPAADVYTGDVVRTRLTEAIATNPNITTPDYGFLALVTGDLAWAGTFREHLLQEAAQGLFTEPAGSVKYGQYLAAQRVYFYVRVRQSFPSLFNPADEHAIREWFAAINRRAQTVEWVDWLYALAFDIWPQGPYENQENGAGLLSLLETSQLSDAALTHRNRAYLDANVRGWEGGFRVMDDAAPYQVEWLENAWFQSLYTGVVSEPNRRLSFEWLKALALPDGRPLRYNHAGYVEYANTGTWGAALLGDENLLWLAGRALESAVADSRPLRSQSGEDLPLPPTGVSPTVGSCLLYGNSGLPTRQGPLAPDKIVFRNGWERDSIYVLLNLRFSGWHRYKASNTVTQIHRGEPLVVENDRNQAFTWLPVGRSLFRDKRIPREHLNGLQIQKRGLAWALYRLTGIGGPWAQDPPFYARVANFDTGGDYDYASIFLDAWHGWQQERRVFFYPEGILVIADDAWGPKGNPATITWHLAGKALPKDNRIHLGHNAMKDMPEAEVIFLSPRTSALAEIETVTSLDRAPILRVLYPPPTMEGLLQTVAVFLFDTWVGSAVTLDGMGLHIQNGAQQISLPLSALWESITP